MRFDLALFRQGEGGLLPPTLRFYSWRPKCISLGYAQKIEKEVDPARARQLGWDIVNRPTGGGIVFHNEAELTYSLVIPLADPILPPGLIPAYKIISEAIVCGLTLLGIKAEIQASAIRRKVAITSLCFAYPAEYEVVADGRKIVGSAQKRGRRALLQQGSIFVREIEPSAWQILKSNYEIPKAVNVEETLKRAVSLSELRQAIVNGFQERLGIVFNTLSAAVARSGGY